MRGYLLGLLTAVLLVLGAYQGGYLRPPQDPCRACGPGTRCEAGVCRPEEQKAAAPAPKKRPRRTGGGAPGAGVGAAVEAPPPEEEPQRPRIQLKPAELKLVSNGDNLSGTEVIDLSQAEGGDHELSQEEIDTVFHKGQGEILACVDEARGDAAVTGRMTVSFRLRRSGAVSGMRLEAPAYLMAHGLYGCVRPIVMRLRFPRSSSGQVVSYPFALH